MPAKWINLADLSVSRLPDLGSGPGVYVFRESATGEWLYIGSTSCLRRRLFGNHLGGVGGATTKRVNGLLFDENRIGDVEVAVHPADDYRQLEERLKLEHAATHDGRLPVWTRR
jgi:predicted GIY-YIG superfamily endonuclease